MAPVRTGWDRVPWDTREWIGWDGIRYACVKFDSWAGWER